jgi:cell wall-associated NlpC family hydrolase
MRILPFAVLMLALLSSHVARAEDGLMEGLKKHTEPLLTALSLVGTPYKYGGNSPEKGLDCSGFVRHVYKESAGLELPRSARQISQDGSKITQDELRPGDLVFFNTLKKPFSHVGIYAGDGKFVHSSSSRSKQVAISSLTERYWSQRYNGARRIPLPQ